MTNEDKAVAPNMGELAAPEDPLELRRPSGNAAPYTQVLSPTDEILSSKGAGNLKIYRELLRDDQVAAAWGQRRLALTSCETTVTPGGDPENPSALDKAAADALKEELDRLLWDDITDKQLFSVFYGWGVAEIMWRPNGSRVSFDRIVVRDRGRFRFGRKGELFLWESAAGWVQMPERKFWTIAQGADHHDEPFGLGLAHSLYWPVFFKRSDIKYWLIFLEKFGMPTSLAKLPPGSMSDPKLRGQALNMLRQIATDAGVLVPDNVTVELLEAARGGAADYQSLHDAMNAAISKIIVGQTMTTDNGSSKSQAEVHAGVAQKIVEADADLLCGSFNAGPVRWWTEWNFPGANPPKVYRATEIPEDLTARAERDSKIYALGFEPTEEYVREHYGEGWEKKQAPAMAPGAMPGAPGFGSRAQNPGNADPAQFAEGELAALQALRAARRGDQQALAEAAKAFADQYETIMARQVGAALQAAEFSEDFETMRARIDEILAQGPAPEAVEKLERATFFSRLLGAFRAQRRA